MARHIRLGVIVPSSNTVVEPVTQAIISSIPASANLAITVHFSRFRVTQIDVSEAADAQFQTSSIVAAASLLADAGVDVIAWSGTSGGWLGFERDQALCAAMEQATGVPATSSIAALNRLLARLEAKRFALVTPYVRRVNEAIRKNYAAVGYEVGPERDRCLDLTVNADFGRVTEEQLDGMVAQVAGQGRADVVAVYCTNLRGARRAAVWEAEYGVVVLDSVATAVWGMLKAVDVSPSCVQGWGSLFSVD